MRKSVETMMMKIGSVYHNRNVEVNEMLLINSNLSRRHSTGLNCVNTLNMLATTSLTSEGSCDM